MYYKSPVSCWPHSFKGQEACNSHRTYRRMKTILGFIAGTIFIIFGILLLPIAIYAVFSGKEIYTQWK